VRGARPGVRGAFAAAVLAGILAAACGPRGAPRPPRNVVCIVIDALRADHLGLYGHPRPTSPHLDALARRSLVVEGMIAQSSWTKPSIGSLFTSLLPSEHQAVREATKNRLAAGHATLAEALQQAGYRTAGFSENPHIGTSTGFDQGFDRFETSVGYAGNCAWVLERAAAWLTEPPPSDRPFFLYLHFLDPHGAYQPDEGWRAAFVGDLETGNDAVRWGLVGELIRSADSEVDLPAADGRYLQALYDAEIRETDRGVARFLAFLEERGLLESTAVLVTADHGEEFLEHGMLKHGYQLYDESVRVPLILAVPGRGPAAARARVQHVDVAPTLLDLVGVPAPGAFAGRSFAGLLRGEAPADAPIVSETRAHGVDTKSVRSGEWTLIVDEKGGGARLFRTDVDPGERTDLYAREAQKAGDLERVLEGSVRDARAGALADTSGAGDPAAEKALKTLGYFGN
jgi:arylsulfatase A-like enzyme